MQAYFDDRRQTLVIVPRHHVIKPGTLKQILDAAELSLEQFNDLL
jgi:predicted RNA binding protein YcfA (HicA-like mRNA interferase family)